MVFSQLRILPFTSSRFSSSFSSSAVLISSASVHQLPLPARQLKLIPHKGLTNEPRAGSTLGPPPSPFPPSSPPGLVLMNRPIQVKPADSESRAGEHHDFVLRGQAGQDWP
ncbi:hypothetical protein Pmani_037147 [Petrolisthes manimaculis]|uniref:Uncharacterized protein n=1 Tax=Petrolisthes manimaculis TaxID=1843537 RepID=A0AAE1NIQ2_9EUCA|nr:hypothetical protein Pmani_037147 [Petrolisthes manimaculis]